MIETTTIDPQTDPVVVAARASLFDAVAAELSRDLVVASQQAKTWTDYDPYDLDRFDVSDVDLESFDVLHQTRFRREALDLLMEDLEEEIENLIPPRGGGGGGGVTNVYVTYADDAVSPRTASSSFDPYVPQGVVGRLMQTLTFGFSAAFADNPTLIDDYLRCSVATRPCTIEETLRKCTYEPKGTWYRERRSRVNAPLSWPYCEWDLEKVYQHCTELERQSSTCDPEVARDRMRRAAWLESEEERRTAYVTRQRAEMEYARGANHGAFGLSVDAESAPAGGRGRWT